MDAGEFLLIFLCHFCASLATKVIFKIAMKNIHSYQNCTSNTKSDDKSREDIEFGSNLRCHYSYIDMPTDEVRPSTPPPLPPERPTGKSEGAYVNDSDFNLLQARDNKITVKSTYITIIDDDSDVQC